MLRVTGAIRLNGLTDEDHRDEFAMARGTAVHEAVALDVRGDLDPASVDERHVKSRLESYQRWRRESGIEVLDVELEVVNEAMGYRGRLDQLLRIAGVIWVADMKCGAPEDWHKYQTALYAMAWASQTGRPTPLRAGIYLNAEGKAAKFIPHSDRRDFERAKALITVAHIKLEQGVAA